MHRTIGLGFRNKDIFLFPLHTDKSKSFRMCLKRAYDLFLFRFAELSSLGADDAPLHHQIIQNLFQLWALIFFHTEDNRQFLDFHRDIHIIAHKVIYHFFPLFILCVHTQIFSLYNEKSCRCNRQLPVSTRFPNSEPLQ